MKTKEEKLDLLCSYFSSSVDTLLLEINDIIKYNDYTDTIWTFQDILNVLDCEFTIWELSDYWIITYCLDKEQKIIHLWSFEFVYWSLDEFLDSIQDLENLYFKQNIW